MRTLSSVIHRDSCPRLPDDALPNREKPDPKFLELTQTENFRRFKTNACEFEKLPASPIEFHTRFKTKPTRDSLRV